MTRAVRPDEQYPLMCIELLEICPEPPGRGVRGYVCVASLLVFCVSAEQLQGVGK